MSLGLAPHSIRVNAIGPGSIQTQVLQSVVSDEAARHRCGPFASTWLQCDILHAIHCCRVTGCNLQPYLCLPDNHIDDAIGLQSVMLSIISKQAGSSLTGGGHDT